MLEQRLNKVEEAESYLLEKKVETETETNKENECYECKKRNETYKVIIESLFFAGACFLSGFLTGLSF